MSAIAMREVKFEVRYTQSNRIRGYEKLTETAAGICGWFRSQDGELWERDVFAGDYIRKQFTGLHDKNGKEIYEGDIIKCWEGEDWRECVEEVIFRDGTFGVPGYYGVTSFTERMKKDDHDEFPFAKIIGNIYENPGLMKGSHDGLVRKEEDSCSDRDGSESDLAAVIVFRDDRLQRRFLKAPHTTKQIRKPYLQTLQHGLDIPEATQF